MKSLSLLLMSGLNVKCVVALISKKCFQPTHLYPGNQYTDFPDPAIPPAAEQARPRLLVQVREAAAASFKVNHLRPWSVCRNDSVLRSLSAFDPDTMLRSRQLALKFHKSLQEPKRQIYQKVNNQVCNFTISPGDSSWIPTWVYPARDAGQEWQTCILFRHSRESGNPENG